MSRVRDVIVCVLPFLLGQLTLQAQFNFTTNNGAITITRYIGSSASVTVPGSTNGLPITSIGTRAFYTNSTLISVTLPGSITNYGSGAFDNCTNLAAVYFNGNAPVSYYPAAAPVFSSVPKATLYYVEGTTGWKSPFEMLPAVQWNPQVLSELIYTNLSGRIVITGYSGPGGPVAIPSTIDGALVRTIESNSFINLASLTGIAIPNTVTNIGNLAFSGCTGLTSLTIPTCSMGNGVFSGCTALTNILIPNTVRDIAEAEFSDCTALTSISMPASITNLGPFAFQNCSSLKALYFQTNAPLADATAFDGANNVTNYYFPKTTGWGATLAGRPTVPILFTVTTNNGTITIFRHVGIESSVVIPITLNGLPVTAIGNSAFHQSPTVTNIIIGSNITNIAGQAFIGAENLLALSVDPSNSFYSSVNGVLFNKNQDTLLFHPRGRTGGYTIPNTVLTIASYAFQASHNLTSVTIPASVTRIKPLAFNADESLVALYFLGNAPIVDSFAFEIQNAVTVFYLPGTTGWSGNLGGLPTALWLPQVQATDVSFGVRTGQFGFNVSWASDKVIVVEASTNPINAIWYPVATNTPTNGSFYFSDPQFTNHPNRFYRLRSP